MSAATVHADIRAALRQMLLAVPGLPGSQQWEGREYNPTRGVSYVSESYRPISSDVRATGYGGTVAHQINGSFTLHYPSNQGTLAIEEMAGDLMDAFRPGTQVAYNTSSGVVQQATRSSLTQEPDWINCAVTISIIAYTANL
jgi:hypothetical protein